MGTVFEVVDLRDQRRLALKTLDVDGERDRKRFKREFLAISRLEHPSLVQVHEYFETPSGACFTMELVDGAHLGEALARVPWKELVPPLCQVLDALGYIHGHRIVHRDVKPENVLLAGWTPGESIEGARAKLTDFGIAKELGRQTASALTVAGGVLGTAMYMAPEQAVGEPVDGRSDLYAFGVMLYEAVTQKYPYPARACRRLLELLGIKQLGEIIDPAEHDPDLPEVLRTLLISLLKSDPAQRPNSAALVKEKLGSLLGDHRASIQDTDDTLDMLGDTMALWGVRARGPMYIRPAIRGREGDLERLDSFASGESTPDSQLCLWIEGQAGIGKTTLLDTWSRRRRDQGAFVFRAACEGGGDDGIQLVQRLLAPVLDRIERGAAPAAARAVRPESEVERCREIIRRHRRLVRLIAPNIVDSSSDRSFSDGVEASDAHVAYRRQMRQMFDLWLELAGDEPALVIIDDLQRVDKSQADLVDRFATYLKVEREGRGRLAVAARKARLILSGRPLVGRDGGPATDLQAALAERRLVEQMRLGPLEQAAAWRFVAELAGVDPSASPPEELAPLIERAGGVPVVLEALIRCQLSTQDTKKDSETSGERSAESSPVGQTITAGGGEHLDRDIQLMIEAEIRRVSRRALDVMRMAAILGPSFDLRTLVELSDGQEDRVLEVLDGVVRLGFVVEDHVVGGSYAFAQAYVSELLINGLSRSRRGVLHRRAAEAILVAGRPGGLEGGEGEQVVAPLGLAGDVADHLLVSDEPRRAVPFLVQAGREALKRLAYSEAARAFRKAFDLSSDELIDGELAEDVADALAGDGDQQEALDWYLRAAELFQREITHEGLSGEGRQRKARVTLKASYVAQRLVLLDRAAELAHDALLDLGMSVPRPGISARLHAIYYALNLDFLRIIRLEKMVMREADEQVAFAEGASISPLLAECVSHYCIAEVTRDVDLWPAFAVHLNTLGKMIRAVPGPVDHYLAERLAYHAIAIFELAPAGKVRIIAEVAAKLAERAPTHPVSLDAQALVLAVRVYDGDLEDGVSGALPLLPDIERFAQGKPAMMLFGTLSVALGLMGRLDEASQAVDGLRRAAQYLQDQHFEIVADLSNTFVQVAANPTPDCVEKWGHAIERATAIGGSFIPSYYAAYWPYVYYVVLGHEASFNAIAAAEAKFEGGMKQMEASMTFGHMATVLIDEIWRRGGLGAAGSEGRQLLKRANGHRKLLTKKARKLRLYEVTKHTVDADYQNLRGRHQRARELYRAARETRVARQSPLFMHYVESREQLWAARLGDEQALDKLRALADQAHEKGWGGHAVIVERHIADIIAFS